jgi:hypothetical protein
MVGRKNDVGALSWEQGEVNTVSARANSEAKFPDGKYKIKIIASDLANHEGITTADVVVDNFKPYLKSVELKQNTQIQYKSETVETINPDDSITYSRNITIDKKIFAGMVKIRLVFSEELPEGSKPTLLLGEENLKLLESTLNTTVLYNDTWIGLFEIKETENISSDSKYELKISGIKDTANNVADSKYTYNIQVDPISIKIIVTVLGDQFQFSPHKPIFTVEFPGTPQGTLNIEAAFKVGTKPAPTPARLQSRMEPKASCSPSCGTAKPKKALKAKSRMW